MRSLNVHELHDLVKERVDFPVIGVWIFIFNSTKNYLLKNGKSKAQVG